MFKKRVISLALVSAIGISFSGCASDGLAINSVSGNKVDRYFLQGTIVEQKKVVIDDREVAALAGAGLGGVGAGVATKSVKNGAIGAVVGGIIGAVVGKEIIAYKTFIKGDNKKDYVCYLKKRVPYGSIVEFTVVDDKLKNVEIVKVNKEKYSL